MDAGSLEKFENDGFVIVKNFLSKDVIDSVRLGCNNLVTQLADELVNAGTLNENYSSEPFETRLKIIAEHGNENEVPLLLRGELHRPEFFSLFCNQRILQVMQQLMPASQRIRIFPNYSIRPKLPQYEAHNVMWHQDAGLTAEGDPNTTSVELRMEAFGPGAMVNCWAPLVQATPETGCMLAVPGSHKLGIQDHKLKLRYRDQEERATYGVYASEIDPEVMQIYENKAVHLACEPGDIIFFSNVLFHRGGFNTSGIVRWSVDWRYQDAAKPTYRKESGHVVWSTNPAESVRNAEEWASLSLR